MSKSLPCINSLANDRPRFHLGYDRYLRIQTKLRKNRRELLLFCQHPPTLTAGIQSTMDSLLTSQQNLAAQAISHFKTRRGGNYTAHEPGQCVIYPHIDLRKRGMKIHAFLDAIIRITSGALLQTWDIDTSSHPGQPGLYCKSDGAKIASIGLMCKAFFTSFGLAVNVSNSLQTFSHIHACGQKGLEITSVQNRGGDVKRQLQFVSLWQQEFTNWLAKMETLN